MHICFITHEYPKIGFPHGGMGSFVKTISHELIKNNIKVSVVGINYTNSEEIIDEQGISIYRLKPSNIQGLQWFFNNQKINKKIKEIHTEKPIHIVETSELGLAFMNKIKFVKYIIRLHGGHHFFSEAENRSVNFWKGFQEKLSFKKADSFIAVSKYVKTHTEKYLSFNKKNVEFINYPINTILFQPIDIDVINNKIVFAGTVCEKKGIRQLIQAFLIVKKTFPNASLDIFGRDWFFPDGSSYVKMLQEKELPQLGQFTNDVIFHGTISYEKIPEKYSSAEVCVFPSHMETQGLVAPEAMAMQKIVVFTKLGPGPETIINFETGLLCSPHDPNDIANKIKWVFENKEKSKLIAQNARKFIIENFQLEKIVTKNINFYKSILKLKSNEN